LYQPIDKSNLFAFYMHYLGCIVLKQGRKDAITNLPARDHVDDLCDDYETWCEYIPYVWLCKLPRTQNKWPRSGEEQRGVESYTPYSKMAAILEFFCLPSNYTLLPRS